MVAEPMWELVVEAVLNDPYDGAIRLLGDAQRFGFEIRSLALTTKNDGSASATMALCVPVSLDEQLVSARLARHPAVQCVSVQADAGRAALESLQVVAA
jgi:hypothetical protein